jgi:hypothetical protein
VDSGQGVKEKLVRRVENWCQTILCHDWNANRKHSIKSSISSLWSSQRQGFGIIMDPDFTIEHLTELTFTDAEEAIEYLKDLALCCEFLLALRNRGDPHCIRSASSNSLGSPLSSEIRGRLRDPLLVLRNASNAVDVDVCA